MSHIEDLVKARLAAIERGDKALGREIYHQLEVLGFAGEDIDAGNVGVEEPVVEEPAKKPVPEKAVRKAPETRKG